MANVKINKIGIILKPSHIEDMDNIITNLVRWLKRRNKEVYFVDSELGRLENNLSKKTMSQVNFIPSKEVYTKLDLIVSMGGDGTVLGVCRNIGPKVPLFSVNIGRLGFITEFEKNEFYEKLNVILMGKFETFKKHLYSMTIDRDKNQLPKEYFFNDAVLTKNDIARMFTISVEADGEHIYNISGDGLILSSSYGSTAYSLAAGGPIVHPDVQALILTPICAHSLTHRPLVIPDTKPLTLKVIEKIDTVNITLDGQVCMHLLPNDVITLSRESRRSVNFIKNTDKTYFHTLKEKFVHGRREIY